MRREFGNAWEHGRRVDVTTVAVDGGRVMAALTKLAQDEPTQILRVAAHTDDGQTALGKELSNGVDLSLRRGTSRPLGASIVPSAVALPVD